MNLEINYEEWEFILKICIRAKAFAHMDILKGISSIDPTEDMEKIDSLIDKLEKCNQENN